MIKFLLLIISFASAAKVFAWFNYGYNCPGHNIWSGDVYNIQKCVDKCKTNSNCVGIVFGPYSGACYLKNAFEGCYADLNTPHALVAVRIRENGLMVQKNYGYNCPGNDISSWSGNIHQCIERCRNTNYCVGVVFAPYSMGCSLKNALTGCYPDLASPHALVTVCINPGR